VAFWQFWRLDVFYESFKQIKKREKPKKHKKNPSHTHTLSLTLTLTPLSLFLDSPFSLSKTLLEIEENPPSLT
jgi:hypothetical protein